jgi:hypothetical protein
VTKEKMVQGDMTLTMQKKRPSASKILKRTSKMIASSDKLSRSSLAFSECITA